MERDNKGCCPHDDVAHGPGCSRPHKGDCRGGDCQCAHEPSPKGQRPTDDIEDEQ